MQNQGYRANIARSSVDAERPHDAPKIRNITLEEACSRGMTFKDTQGITNAAIRSAVYEYHFLLVTSCYNISV